MIAKRLTPILNVTDIHRRFTTCQGILSGNRGTNPSRFGIRTFGSV
jgi:hypothetical protein